MPDSNSSRGGLAVLDSSSSGGGLAFFDCFKYVKLYSCAGFTNSSEGLRVSLLPGDKGAGKGISRNFRCLR